MISRWYRSRSFWFGLAGLVMLLVTWFSAARAINRFYWRGSLVTCCFVMEPGVVHADIHRSRSTAGWPLPGFGMDTTKLTEDWKFHLTPFFRLRFSEGVQITVGHSIIVTVYLLAWITGMVWWLRRQQRLIHAPLPENHPELQPSVTSDRHHR
ncbi:MAG: hypothetical protein EOP88_07705 [Verrucomicrobiaceae bacterium]|nr:MAG: hypothetical protein EOP88_07705 [Verrucomicrobiaceae bacterium]